MRLSAQNGPSSSADSANQRWSISQLGVPYPGSAEPAIGVLSIVTEWSGGEQRAQRVGEERLGVGGREAAVQPVEVERLQLAQRVGRGQARATGAGGHGVELRRELLLHLLAERAAGELELFA